MANARHQGYSHTMEQLSRRQHMPPPHGQGTQCHCVSLSVTHTQSYTHTWSHTHHTTHTKEQLSRRQQRPPLHSLKVPHTHARVRTSSGVF